MQKIKVKITGAKVHDVGYRVLLVNKALFLGVNNFNTFNTFINDTQTVIAIIEGDVETVEDFKNFVTAFMPKESIVENISFEQYKNTVPPIERVMQAFQMEHWGKAILILLQNTSILKEFKNESNDNFADLKTILTDHDIDARERVSYIKKEISEIKERLSTVEAAVTAL
jgi:acylphosphatase